MNSNNQINQNESSFLDQYENIKSIITNNVKFLAISGFIIFTLFFINLLNIDKSYTTFTKIKILEEKETSAFALEGMMNLSSPLSNDKEVENEVEIIKSKNVLEKIVSDLYLNQKYTKNNFFGNTSYNQFNSPINIEVSGNHKINFNLNFKDENQFEISNDDITPKMFELDKPFIFGSDTVEINYTGIIPMEELIGNEFSFSKNELYLSYISLKRRLNIKLVTESILEISISGSDFYLNEKIINAVLDTYKSDREIDKRIVSQNTSYFLADRIDILKDEIKILENSLSSIKKDGDIFDMQAKNIVYGDQKMKSASMNFEVETQELLAKSFLQKLNQQNENELLPLPIDLGLENEKLSSFTSEYNELIKTKQALLTGRTDKNPEIQFINSQLNGLLKSLQNSLNQYISSLTLKKQKLNDYKNSIEYDYHKLNDVELTVLRLTKELEVKSNILLFLFQRLEENDLKLSAKSPIYKILDFTYTDFSKPTPKPSLYLIAGFLIAIFIPLGFVIIKQFLNNKISDKNSVERILNSNIPIIGEIPEFGKNLKTQLKTIHEAFRLVRTNLFFTLKKDEKVILITSSIKGEGKSLVSVNLAKNLASLNENKVIVLGLDLRNPQLHSSLNIERNSSLGLTNYLIDGSIDLNPMIEKVENIDIIQSGPIPPNPTELLLSNNLNQLLEVLKSKYDYIILDTAPCLLVSDTLNFTKLSDQTIYVTRSNHTDVKVISYINKLYEDNSFNKLSLVINGVPEHNLNYGYSYGYEHSKQ